jgi:kynurenine formamidase
MPRFVDLSHDFADGMPGLTMKGPDGDAVTLTARIRPFVTHEQSRANYGGKAEFTMTEMSFKTSLGTYLDSPYVRWQERRDIAALRLDELVLPGLLLDLGGRAPGTAVEPHELAAAVSAGGPLDVAGKAVLCRFGWDRRWGRPDYGDCPYLSRASLRFLIDGGARLLGVDCGNVDSFRDPERPAHSWLLERDILVVENLRGLEALAGADSFRFFALPIKAKGAGSMPVRAFAEIAGG